jgi:hypothetical protein
VGVHLGSLLNATDGGDLVSGSCAKRQKSESSQYRYTPLQTSQSIRLLQLSRGERDDPIQCYLFEVRLDNRPIYEAVSYMWGDPSDKTLLNCNDETISVPRNLVEGLRMLRRPDRLRILWADAICINQKDVEERGSQVALMARIFSEASRVLVWLGHGNSSLIQRALSYICWYLNREGKNYIAEYSWGREDMSADDSEAIAFKVPADDVTMKALWYLFECPYFSRGWIVQELVLPRSVQVYCNEACINYRLLEENQFQPTNQPTNRLLEDFVRKSHSSDAQRISASRFRMNDYRILWIRALREKLHDIPTSIAFSEMLRLTRHQNFSDPKDCVYGLLGLQRLCRDMRFQHPLFKPDYTISRAECYKSFVETLLIGRGDISVLTLVRHSDLVVDNLPSWVPRLWDQTRIEGHLNKYYHRFKPAKILKPTVSRQQYGGYDCIQIRGVRVSKLKAVIADRRQSVKDIQTLLNTLVNHWGERRVAWTMTFGHSLGKERMFEYPARELDHVDVFREFIFLNVEGTKQPHESLERNLEAHRYYEVVCAVLRRYALFETEDNKLGIARPSIQPGDQVVLFLGGRMPFVLRPVGTKWRLIGVCYVHDIMDGGPVNNMKHDPRYMAEDFDII